MRLDRSKYILGGKENTKMKSLNAVVIVFYSIVLDVLVLGSHFKAQIPAE